MIISKKHRFVFISTPKAGTHSLYALLRERFAGEHLSIMNQQAVKSLDAETSEEWMRRLGQLHMRDIPPEYEGWFAFTVVRNPFSRAVSLWWTTTRFDPYKDTYVPKYGGPEFVKFTRWLVAFWRGYRKTRRQPRRWKLFVPQHEWLKTVKLDAVLDLDRIDEELSALPFVTKAYPGGVEVPVTMSRKKDYGSWQDFYPGGDSEEVQNIRAWGAGDFAKYDLPIHLRR